MRPQSSLVDERRAGHNVVAVAASGRPCAPDEVLIKTAALRGFEFVVGVTVLANHVVTRHVC